jgi:transcriptional regulator with XRE-family HTH domain
VDKLFQALGRRIRELRTTKGWSQERFAEICGVHRTYMGHLERGEKNASLGSVARVARAFGIALSELLSGIDVEPASTDDGRPGETQPVKSSSKVGRSGDIARVMEELQVERQTLRDTVLALKEVALIQSGRGGSRTRRPASRSRSGEKHNRSTSPEMKKSTPASDKDV